MLCGFDREAKERTKALLNGHVRPCLEVLRWERQTQPSYYYVLVASRVAFRREACRLDATCL